MTGDADRRAHPAGGRRTAGRPVRRWGGAGGRLGPVTVLAVVLAGAVTACGGGGDVPVSPLPVQPPSVAATPTPGPSAPAPTSAAPPPTTRRPVAAPTSRRPTPSASTRTPTATSSPTRLPDSCEGAVRYDLVLAETELALVPALCFATGAVLRIIGIGPGEVTVDREDLVSRNYAAGVVDIRFVRPGTVTVRIPQEGTTYPVTVVVR
ncbi:hypothetical protein ACQSSU_11645 [Micromonospora echinospora]